MSSLATHVLVDLWGVDRALLDDPLRLQAVLLEAAAAAKCEVLGSVHHKFEPHGASVVVLLAESHLSVHTWPEADYAACDLLTCGLTLPEQGVNALIRLMKPHRHQVRRLDRGSLGKPAALSVL